MNKPDVEELLQQLKGREVTDKYTASTLISFMEGVYFIPVSKPAYFVFGISFLAVLSIACAAFSRRLRMRIQEGLKRAKAGILTTYFNAGTFTFLILVWVTLIALSTVFSLMKMAAVRMNLGSQNQTLPKELCEWLTLTPILLFIPKFLGALAVWLYALLLGGFLEIGVAASLLVCFPAFYESLCLSGKEPDRTPMWITHTVFFVSLFVACCMVVPWLTREFGKTVCQIQGYTANLSYYNRQEYKDLKNYKRVVSKKKE